MIDNQQNWLALAIGNSRLHWGWFCGGKIQLAWDSDHLTQPIFNNQIPSAVLPKDLAIDLSYLPICLASVVPQQTLFWQNYQLLQVITLSDIPLNNLYCSLGIDRALAVWSGGNTYGFPCLVIDAGTALTFTGVERDRSLVGGAILPGLRLQFLSLNQNTAALPSVKVNSRLPSRWALDTTTAIESGIIHTVLAGIVNFITDWWQKFPDSLVIFTGGDADYLFHYLPITIPEMADKIKVEPNLILSGIKLIYLSEINNFVKKQKYN